MGVPIEVGLREKLHPVALRIAIFRVDPCVGGHQLERQHRESGGESKAGQQFDEAFIFHHFVIVVHALQRRHLGRRGKRSSERLGRRLELDRGFWKRNGGRQSGGTTGAGRCASAGQPDRRRGSHRGGCAARAQRNGRSGRARRATGRSRRCSRNRRADWGSHRHCGRGDSRRRIGGFQRDANGFLFQGHARSLFAQRHAASQLGGLVVVIAHSLGRVWVTFRSAVRQVDPRLSNPQPTIVENFPTYSR